MPSRSLKRSTAPIQSPLQWDKHGLVAGVDEAGRGALAGPVVAAAVILDDAQPIVGLNDSKKLSAAQRERLYAEIMSKALCCAVGQASHEEIDHINILQATLMAMQRAVAGLRLKPAKVWVDGNQLPKLDVLAEALVGGDALMPCISAASIVAKVTRDRLMTEYAALYPNHGFDGHKGYGVVAHVAALRAHGAVAIHRKTFAPLRHNAF